MSKAPSTFELRTISSKSDQDIVYICLSTYAAHNSRLSGSDMFTHAGNTLYGLGEGRHTGGFRLLSKDDCFSMYLNKTFTQTYQCKGGK